MTQGFAPAFSHHFDWEASVKIGNVFPFLELGFFARNKCIDESIVLVFIQWAIDIVFAGAPGAWFVIAGLKPGFREVY